MRTLPILCATLLAATARAQGSAPAPPASAPAGPAPAVQPQPPAALEAIEFPEAIERASQHATSARIAAQEVRRAEALLVEARSGALPQLVANGIYTRLDANRTLSGRVVAAEEQKTANLTLTIPLFVPSRWYQWSHASDQLSVARASERDVRRSVTLLAARAYLAIIAQKRAIEVSGRAVDTARAHLDFAHARRLGGVGNLLDEARAEQQYATSQAQLENALAGLTRAQEALGIAVGSDRPVDARNEPDLSGSPATPEEGLREADAARPDVLAARERAQAAHRVARDSWADRLPTVSGVGQPFYQNPATLTTPETGWQAQLVVSFPLFEGLLRVGQQRERDALDSEARAQLDGLVQQAHSEVRTAYETLRHAQAALTQSRHAADSARAALSVVERAYRAGATTSLEVVDAERQARDADSAAVVAEDAVRQSRLDLLAAIGRFP